MTNEIILTLDDDKKDYKYETTGKVIKAKEGDDVIIGTRYDDTIHGGRGHDLLSGLSGDDKVYGGKGDDILMGDYSHYDLDGRSVAQDLTVIEGNDILYGGTGNDRIFGQGGDDKLYGGKGNDQLWASVGDDELRGGPGKDLMFGGGGKDTLYGGDQNDDMDGGPGDDKLYGGNGNDRIVGDDGNDLMVGGKGNDWMGWLWNLGRPMEDGEDLYYGGEGNDAIGGKRGDKVYGEDGDDFLSAATRRGRIKDDHADLIAEKDEAVIYLEGGPGADRFELAKTQTLKLYDYSGGQWILRDEKMDAWNGGGNVTIGDFEDGVDLLQMTDFSRDVVEDVVASATNDKNGDAVISWEHPDHGHWGKVTLAGVDASQISIDDFVYGEDSITAAGWLVL